MQLLAVANGGRLHQHLPDVRRARASTARRPGVYGEHPVRFAAGQPWPRRCSAARPRSTRTTTRAVADPGRLMRRPAGADDGLIEAVEDPDRPFVLGVQWHPENEPDPRPMRLSGRPGSTGRPGRNHAGRCRRSQPCIEGGGFGSLWSRRRD